MNTTQQQLEGIYKTTTTTVKVHAAGCNMLNACNERGVMRLTAEDIVDARDAQGFKVVYCKCCGDARLPK